MAKKDIHKSSFDDGTKIKLHILKEYFKEWLPVFTKRKELFWKDIYVYDFFAGEGTDVDGQLGSPLIIIDEIKTHCKALKDRNISCSLIFNEFDFSKVETLHLKVQNLKESCSKEDICPNKNSKVCPFSLEIHNKDFQTFFNDMYLQISEESKLPRFMFLDQYGIKQITNDIFKKLVSLNRTDFIFFISSSFADRFADMPEFRQYLNLSREDFDIGKPYQCHRVIFNYYKHLIPSDTQYFLAPFSIKKKNNIYGLIFGTNHTLGIEKFLNICWKINDQTGDANFDIDNEKINRIQPNLFAEFDIPNKLALFKEELKNKISKKEICSNIEMYNFAFEMGCLPKHANDVIKEMVNDKVLKRKPSLLNTNVHKVSEDKFELS
ncbi:MAG: three-Cys-motif partner protein TcmP [Dysgonomonas sp.]